MTNQRLLRWGFLTMGAMCLAACFALTGKWVLFALAGLAWLAGMLAAGWATVIFIGMVGLAAVGICAGAWSPLMILGAAFALAGWDQANWEGFLTGGLPAGAVTKAGRKHYAYLAAALGAGACVAILGRSISFRLPFGVLIVLAILVVLGLDQVWRLVKG